MAARASFSACPRRPKASRSAPDDAHGIRKTMPPRRRWRPTNISPNLFWNAPASRRSAADISSCTTGIGRIARRVTNAATRWNISDAGRFGVCQAAVGIARRFCAGHPWRSGFHEYLDDVSRHYDAILIQAVVSGMKSGFSCSTTRSFIPRGNIRPCSSARRRRDRELLANHNATLQSRGLSPAATRSDENRRVLPKGERWEIPGR